ncbi:transcriptional regulator GcvA [Achromobacter mucicolens]|uniref:transcriptional regulator GcvA n=1 Tax=Achromobacter mucicolens TaxID=1389922 RepID=UPI0020A2F8BD|nr:transcriptional regulator GcvA [Achromobacter mucicolens]MCP2513756.1 transcriptional regulator GcvA [Achromobacter mucicolens]
MTALPPLNALRCFEVAGRLGSITSAAEELSVTPAAISRQIRLLEEHLGLKLFLRQHRRIVLTSMGAAYHADISRCFGGMQRATSELGERSRRRQFVIKAPHSVAMRWLLPRLSGFHRQYPDIDVKLHTAVDAPDFEREEVDAGICMGDGRWRGLVSYKLMVNELLPVCVPGKCARLRTPADLKGEILLHTLARPDYWEIWLQAAGLTDIDVTRGLRYESSALAYEAALEGYGVAIAQKPLVQKELDEGRLVAPFDLTVDLGAQSYYFVLPPEDYRRPSAELTQFRAWAASCAI